MEHRERIVIALGERNWAAIYSLGLPRTYSTDTQDDEEYPPMAPDLHLPARVAEAVIALYCLASKQ